MITWLMKQTVGLGIPGEYAKPLLIALAACLAALACVGLKSCYDNRVISRHETEVKAQVLEKTVKANDRSAERRAQDTITNTKKEEARKDAIAQTTDETPSAPSRALGCVRLREQGYDTSRFPACR